jgi:hypothetical protein
MPLRLHQRDGAERRDGGRAEPDDQPLRRCHAPILPELTRDRHSRQG